jgi:hypothetical protein
MPDMMGVVEDGLNEKDWPEGGKERSTEEVQVESWQLQRKWLGAHYYGGRSVLHRQLVCPLGPIILHIPRRWNFFRQSYTTLITVTAFFGAILLDRTPPGCKGTPTAWI